MDKIKNHTKKWTYLFTLGLALIVIFKVLDNFGTIMGATGKFLTILQPFLIGLFIAYLLYMPCKKIEEWLIKRKTRFLQKSARPFSIAIVYIILLLLIAILVGVILPIVGNGVKDLVENLQYYVQTTIQNFENLPEDSFLKSDIVKDAIAEIQKIDIKQYVQWDKILEYIKNAIDAVSGIFNIFIMIIVSIYILMGRTALVRFFKRLMNAIFKDATYGNVSKYFDKSNEVFFKFITSQFLDAIIVGILTTIAMTIMGVKYAPVLGFLIGISNMIPYVGAIVGVGISAIITLITGGLSQAVWMLIVVIILQQIDANIINPKIVGRSLEISPLLVLFAVTVSGRYFGILGMFLAVPIVAILKILVEDFIDYRLAKKEIIKNSTIKINNN